MAQSLSEIMAELDPQFSGQKALIATQQAALPGQAASEYAGLDTAKQNAFTDVTNGANSRGVLYSGAPIDEQNRYVGEKYLPARAAVASDYQNRGFKLQEALLGVTKAQGDQAYAIRSQQQDRDEAARQHAQALAEQQRQFDQQQAAARRAAAVASQGLNLGGLSSKPAAAPAPFKLSSDPKQAIAQLYQGYAPGKIPYYTENVVLPKMVEMLRSTPGYSPYSNAKIMQLAKEMVFNYRKQNFGE